MHIFYAADTSPNASFSSQLWRNNLYHPLVDLGHEVVEFHYDMRATFQQLDTTCPGQMEFIRRNRPRLTAALLKQVRAAQARKKIDLFFSYFADACVEPEAIDEIRRMGIVTVNWYCNGSYQMHLVEKISPRYDWCLVPEKFRLKDYETLGARPLYCQEAANPFVYKPYDTPYEFDVTFVGQAYGERPAHIRHLLDAGLDVRVFGSGWRPAPPPPPPSGLAALGGKARDLFGPRGMYYLRRKLNKILPGLFPEAQSPGAPAPEPPPLAARFNLPASILGGILSDEEMVRMYSRSKINLGFSSVDNAHLSGERIVQVRLRDFEVPMSGGFYMVEHMEELEEFFEIGKEIVCYTGMDDLAEKIRYYLRHDTERERIRRAGRARCLRDHSWHHRFFHSFQKMGLEPGTLPAFPGTPADAP